MTRHRFVKSDWLDHGLKQLGGYGPEALKLDAICASAGRTKGSFYHHFKDHSVFLTSLVMRWIELHTDAVIQALPEDATALEKGSALTEIAIALDYHLELGIRELSRRNADLSNLVSQADERRMAFLSDLYEKSYGIGAEDARFAARVEYAAYVGTIMTRPDISKAEQRGLSERFQSVMASYFASCG